MSQCKGRYADKECYFKNGTLYYTEKRCLGKATGEDSEDPELCKWCIPKSKIPFESADQKFLYQGKVGEAYFKKSHLFGSPWFLRRNEHEDYTIEKEEFKLAKQAQREAIEGKQMPPRKKKEEAAAPAEAKKPRAPRKPKVVAAPAPAPMNPSAPSPVAVETLEEPLEALEVVKIPVQLKTIGEKSYWYDSKKSKVYEKLKDQGIGKYLGRYHSAEDKVVDFPDSDVDV